MGDEGIEYWEGSFTGIFITTGRGVIGRLPVRWYIPFKITMQAEEFEGEYKGKYKFEAQPVICDPTCGTVNYPGIFDFFPPFFKEEKEEKPTELEPAVAPKPKHQLTEFQGDNFYGKKIIVDSDFVDALTRIDRYAQRNHVKIKITSSFRTPEQKLTGLVAKTGKRSNHFVGHGIDMNVLYDGTLYSSTSFADFDSLPWNVRNFINDIRADSELRWGGDFKNNFDPVHIDDGLNHRDRKAWEEKFNAFHSETDFTPFGPFWAGEGASGYRRLSSDYIMIEQYYTLGYPCKDGKIIFEGPLNIKKTGQTFTLEFKHVPQKFMVHGWGIAKLDNPPDYHEMPYPPKTIYVPLYAYRWVEIGFFCEDATLFIPKFDIEFDLANLAFEASYSAQKQRIVTYPPGATDIYKGKAEFYKVESYYAVVNCESLGENAKYVEQVDLRELRALFQNNPEFISQLNAEAGKKIQEGIDKGYYSPKLQKMLNATLKGSQDEENGNKKSKGKE